MRAGMIALVVAIGVVAWLPQLPPWWLIVGALVVVLIVAVAILLRCRYRSFLVIGSVSFGASLGLLYAVLSGHLLTASLLPVALEQQPLWLSGRIVGLIENRPAFGHPAQRFSLRVEDCHHADNTPCAVKLHTVQLTAYSSQSSPQPIPIASGERWRFLVKLKRPHGLANPGGFDFESWLVQQRFSATGIVEAHGQPQRLAVASMFSVDRSRAAVRDTLQRRLQSFAHSPLLLALLVGDGSAITREDWLLFRSTGTVHLFVVSGSHIAFTGGLVWWLGRFWRRLPFSTGSRREHVLCALPALLVALGYALLAGMGLPIQRALIMFAVVLTATTLRRDVRFFDALLLALVLVLLRDPLAARDAGCWFSFAAVAALALAFTGVAHSREAGSDDVANGDVANGEAERNRWGWLRAQWLIFVVCLPVLMLIGGQLTLLSLPANFIAVPLTTVATLPLAFAALLFDAASPVLGHAPGQWCWYAADLSLHGLLSVLGWLRDVGGGLVLPLAMSPLAGLFALLAVLLLILPRGVPGRALALLLLLPVLWPRHPAVPDQSVRVTVIDVGQGLSVLVETQSHRLLYDTGPAFGTGSSAAEQAVLPLLQQRGVRKLDMLMVSHRDSDHAGGVSPILQALPVDEIRVGDLLPVVKSVQNSCAAGQQWRWDNVQFTVISPLPDAVGTGNNHSCVVWIEAGQASVLLAGDIESPVEQRLLADAHLHPTTVLVVPHHGSRSSSSTAFVEALVPRYAVFSTGYLNRFGHPHPQVTARYRAAGAQLLDTAATGALTFELRSDGVAEVTEYRKNHRHFWD